MEVRTITDISTEPVTLAVMKNRIKAKYGTDATEDNEITSMIKTARQLIEVFCNISAASKVIEIFYHADEVVAKRVRLPRGPHSVMTSGYPLRINQQGNTTAMTLNTDYYKRGNMFWELEFLTSTINPWSEGDVTDDDYKIRLTAGYGITGDNATETLPQGFVEAIKLQVLQWYHNRFDGELSGAVMDVLKHLTKNTYL
jgi:hypothetical protein